MTVREIVIYVLGIVLFVVCFVLGTGTNFFNTTKDAATATYWSLALSIGVFLVTDRCAASARETNLHASMCRAIESLASRFPQLTAIVCYPNCNAAMEYLCCRIPDARVAWNTKISIDAVPAHHSVADAYEQAIQKGLRSGLVYKDVISAGFKHYAERLAEYAKTRSGEYRYAVNDAQTPTFLNFIVLEYGSGEEEVVFGWATSSKHGNEQPAFCVRDSRVVQYFKSYHGSLQG